MAPPGEVRDARSKFEKSTKNMRSKLRLVLASVACAVPAALAQTPPTYTGNVFDKLQVTTEDGLLYFGFIAAAAVLVTGFFLGRKWLRRVG